MRGVLYRTEKDGTTLAVPELRISASNSRTVYYENNAAKQSALNNNEIREGSIVLTGLAGNNEDYATKAYVDSKIGNSEHQVGVIVGFPGNVPNGYLLCDGSRFDKNKYPELYEYLGTDVLPDYRECVLVGAGQNTTNSIATHDVYTVGQFKDDQIQGHTHYVDLAYSNWGKKSVDSNRLDSSQTTDISYTNKTPLKDISGARTGTTTHGKQKGLNWAIKAAPITISSSPIQYQEGDLLKLKQQPDWENADDVTYQQVIAGYVAPADGWFVGNALTTGGTATANYLYVNGVVVSRLERNNGYTKDANVQVQVNKGDVIRFENNVVTYASFSFVPFKTTAEPLTLPVNVMNNPSLPDWGRAIAITAAQLQTGYVCPNNGFIVGNGAGTSAVTELSINNVICAVGTYAGSTYVRLNICATVQSGNIVKTSANLNTVCQISFVPLKN